MARGCLACHGGAASRALPCLLQVLPCSNCDVHTCFPTCDGVPNKLTAVFMHVQAWRITIAALHRRCMHKDTLDAHVLAKLLLSDARRF